MEAEKDLENDNGGAEEEEDDFEIIGKELNLEEQEALAENRKKKSLLIQKHRVMKSRSETRPTLSRKFGKNREFTLRGWAGSYQFLDLTPAWQLRWPKREGLPWRGDDGGGTLWMWT
ncbi:hypothetical protein NL676_031420 [Syzygium grande]|nr:hypothetical protein NL676_031420 [Syzygium grande]